MGEPIHYRNFKLSDLSIQKSPNKQITYNVLYKEKIEDMAVESKKLGDFDLIIDYSEIYRIPWYQLPCDHEKEIIYKYVIPLKNIQFVVECVKHGEKCLPSDAYFQIKDLQLLAVEDTAKEFNEFLLSLN